MKKQKPWSFHELAIGQGPEFAASIANNTLAQSCGAVSTVESSIAEIMKKNKISKVVGAMREEIEIVINSTIFKAEISFEMLDGVITDINTLFVLVDDLYRDWSYLIETLKIDLIEDIELKLMEGVKDED